MKPLHELLYEQAIQIDFRVEILYETCVIYNNKPVSFPVVTFELQETQGLREISDAIREQHGYKALSDENGWYDYFIGINGHSPYRTNSCIEFVVRDETQPDDEHGYMIHLSFEDQEALYIILDEQCRKHLNVSCQSLLDEAAERNYG